MKKTRILTGIIILILVISGFYLAFFRKEKADYSLVKVSRGNVAQVISETGTVKKGEEINLSFQNSGKIEKIYIKIGDVVTTRQNLAKVDTSQLIIELSEAQASLQVAEAQQGDAQISLENTERDLNNIKSKTEEDLNNAYEDALNVLDDAYLKIYNAFNVIYNIQKIYFSTPNEYGLKVGDEKYRIENALKRIESLVNETKNNPQSENIDSALSEAKELLEKVSNALKGIRDITENAVYRDIVSSTDKTSLDTQKLNINTVFTNVINTQQNISTVKITNTADIDSTEAEVFTLQAQLGSGGLYEAQIDQARAQISILQKQIQESTLQSPVDGQVTDVKKREGETVQPAEKIISLLPASLFQIEVDIYEEDIVKVKVGNPVDIKLAAFPEKIFRGEVISIDPAEKLIEGVVYYEVTVNFGEPPEELKPGMTADVDIKTALKENVLVIPSEAIGKKNQKSIVQVIKGKNFKEQEIEVGLDGSDNMTEVISGLKEGEEIILR